MSLNIGATTMPDKLPAVDSGWNFQDPAASEANFLDLIERGQALGDSAYVVETMTQLARSIGMQRRFDEAHSVLNEVESMLTEDMPLARVRLLLERGRANNSGGDSAGSIEHFEEALSISRSFDLEYLAVDAAHMLGIVEQPDNAIRWNETAIEMAEAAEDERARTWLGPLYNNLAWTYNDLGKHEDALALFEKDILFRESLARTLHE